MKQTITLSSILSIIFLLTSCNPKFYTPNTQNVPMISQKGETNLSLSGNGNQVEFQGAYGVGEQVAIKANGGLFIPQDLENGNGGSGKFLEVGAGYFKPVNQKFVFDTYAILGFGSFENHLPSTLAGNPQTTGEISAGLLRIGIQPSFGYKSKYFSAAISSRIAHLSYNNIEGSLIYDGDNQVDYLENHSSNILIEPALTLRGGIEKLKFQLQYGYSINASNSDFPQDKTFLTLGLNFNFY